MTDAASQHAVHSAFHLFWAVSSLGETGNPLTEIIKLPAVSPFHGFGGTPPAKFKGDRPRLENSQRASPENGETAKRIQIYLAIPDTCPFHPGLKWPETPLRAQDG